MSNLGPFYSEDMEFYYSKSPCLFCGSEYCIEFAVESKGWIRLCNDCGKSIHLSGDI